MNENDNSVNDMICSDMFKGEVRRVRTYEECIRFADFVYDVAQYFEELREWFDRNPEYIHTVYKCQKHASLGNLREVDFAGYSGSGRTSVFSIYVDPTRQDCTEIGGMGLINHSPGGIDLDDSFSDGENTIYEYTGNVPHIYDEDQFFQYSTTYNEKDLLCIVLHSELKRRECCTFFFDTDYMIRVANEMKVSLADYGIQL